MRQELASPMAVDFSDLLHFFFSDCHQKSFVHFCVGHGQGTG